jgi:NADPH-dependent ferric siderophore reductase
LQDPQLARYLLAGDPHPDPAIAALIERIRRA